MPAPHLINILPSVQCWIGLFLLLPYPLNQAQESSCKMNNSAISRRPSQCLRCKKQVCIIKHSVQTGNQIGCKRAARLKEKQKRNTKSPFAINVKSFTAKQSMCRVFCFLSGRHAVKVTHWSLFISVYPNIFIEVGRGSSWQVKPVSIAGC